MFHYLQPYLNEVKTVIIPDLGAITITNPDTGETMFMSFLKHDDGKFAEYIAKKESIDTESAKAKLSAAVTDILSGLNAEGKVTISGLGSFVQKDGEIDFIANSEVHEEEFHKPAENKIELDNQTEDQTSIVSDPVVASEKPEPELEETKSVEIPKEKVSFESVTEESLGQESEIVESIAPTTPDSEEIQLVEEKSLPEELTAKSDDPGGKEVIDQDSTETPVIQLESGTKDQSSGMNILQKEQLAASQKKLDDLKKAKENKPAEKKRSAGFWMLMVLIGLISVGGTFVGIYYDEVKQHIPFLADATNDQDETNDQLQEMQSLLDEGNDETEQAATSTNESAPEDEPSEESIESPLQETHTPEPIATPYTTPSSSSEMPWHLIAGTFSIEDNAQRLANNLRKEGFSPIIRQVGAMYLVSAKGFASKEAALAGKSELGSAAPKAWLYEWK